jgi:hypothetical protein
MTEAIKISDGFPIMRTPTASECETVAMFFRRGWRHSGGYMGTVRLLMLAGFCLLIIVGCGKSDVGFTNISSTPRKGIVDTAPVFTVTVQDVAKKQDALLTQVDSFASKSLELNQAIVDKLDELNGSILETRRTLGTMEASLSTADPNRKDGDSAAREPQETERKSQTTPLLSDSPPAVRLFVTQADFPCAPCERMRRAIEAGEFSEFDIVESPPFDGQQSYPATRFRSRTSPTGWRVIYGFNDSTIAQIKANIDGTARSEVMTGPLTGAFFQYPKDSAILSQRSDLRSDNRSDRRRRRPVNSAFSWLIPATSNQW